MEMGRSGLTSKVITISRIARAPVLPYSCAAAGGGMNAPYIRLYAIFIQCQNLKGAHWSWLAASPGTWLAGAV